MDRASFCDRIKIRLRELNDYVQAQTFAAPSTLEKAQQQEQRRPVVEALRSRIAEIMARVDQLSSSNDPQWTESTTMIERDCATIEREVDELRSSNLGDTR